MSLRYHEISESNHRILNPFTDEKLMTLGEACRLQTGQRQLDLACGKGEMLCRWAKRFGIWGLGVDISHIFLAAARERALELGVADHVKFEQGDASSPRIEPTRYDVVSCIGASWIGGGLAGTIGLMRPMVQDDGLLLIGEPYWLSEPPAEVCAGLQVNPDTFASLLGTADKLAAAGVELVEMVLADQDCWDRYVAAQWRTLSDWLRARPNDPEAPGLRRFLDDGRRSYLAYSRNYLGWGVFVGRVVRSQ